MKSINEALMKSINEAARQLVSDLLSHDGDVLSQVLGYRPDAGVVAAATRSVAQAGYIVHSLDDGRVTTTYGPLSEAEARAMAEAYPPKTTEDGRTITHEVDRLIWVVPGSYAPRTASGVNERRTG